MSSEEKRARGQASVPSDHPVWDVWQSIKQAYPGSTMNWDEEPSVEWAYAIDGLSQEKIAIGLKAMIQEGGEFPPSAPIFRALCGAYNWELARSARPASEVLAAPIIDKGADQHLISEIPESDLEKTPAEHMAEMKTGLF